MLDMSEKMVLMRSPSQVLDSIELILEEVGGKKFFSLPDQEMQRHRESFSAMFFLLAVKKATKLDWWLCQSDEPFPDFTAIAFGSSVSPEGLPVIFGEQCEHVEIPADCQSALGALQIVQSKFVKKYDSPKSINLVIFINHVQSEEWIPFLAKHMPKQDYFKSVWAVHLKFSAPHMIKRAVIHQLRPEPIVFSYADMDEPGLFFNKARDDIFMPLADNSQFGTIRPEIAQAIKKSAIRSRLGK